MELNHDWRGFRSVFQPRRKAGAKPVASDPATENAPIHLVVDTDGQTILAGLGGEDEDFGPWLGRKVDEMLADYAHREIVKVDRREADVKLAACLALSHFHDQAVFVREQTQVARVGAQGAGELCRLDPGIPNHFLLAGLQGWWSKILPSAYGVFVRLENESGATGASVFVLFRRGRLELFHSPDLTSLGAERARQPAQVVKYLAEKHAVPVQGLVVSAGDWADWSDHRTPKDAWKKLALAVQSNDAQLVPFRWQLMTLVATRAFLGF